MSSKYDIITDRFKVGPGVWISSHIIAFYASTRELQTNYCMILRMLYYNFPCSNCRQHAMEYIEKKPPEMAISDDPTSLFKWTVDFHNHVNITEKHEAALDWKLLYKKYQENAPEDLGIVKSTKTPIQKANDVKYQKLMMK